MSTLKRAIEIAKEAHAGQTRWGGAPEAVLTSFCEGARQADALTKILVRVDDNRGSGKPVINIWAIFPDVSRESEKIVAAVAQQARKTCPEYRLILRFIYSEDKEEGVLWPRNAEIRYEK